jgi:hypothetical protein
MSYETYEVRIYSDGSKEWYQNGKRHRLDGPAVESSDGSKEWWINGIKYSEKDFNLFIEKENKIKELKTSCDGQFVEVDGVKYKLIKV